MRQVHPLRSMCYYQGVQLSQLHQQRDKCTNKKTSTPLLYFKALHLCLHDVRKLYELLHGELLRALRHDVLGVELGRSRTTKYLAQAHAQHLTALVEHGLHYALEQTLVATEVGHSIARHAYHRTLHLWRRIEHRLVDSKEILYVVPSLDEHRQDAICLCAGCRCDIVL